MLEAIQWTADAGVSAAVAVNLLVGGGFEVRPRQAYSGSRPTPAPVGGGAWFWPAVTYAALHARMCAGSGIEAHAHTGAHAHAYMRAHTQQGLRRSRSFGLRRL